ERAAIADHAAAGVGLRDGVQNLPGARIDDRCLARTVVLLLAAKAGGKPREGHVAGVAYQDEVLVAGRRILVRRAAPVGTLGFIRTVVARAGHEHRRDVQIAPRLGRQSAIRGHALRRHRQDRFHARIAARHWRIAERLRAADEHGREGTIRVATDADARVGHLAGQLGIVLFQIVERVDDYRDVADAVAPLRLALFVPNGLGEIRPRAR